MALHVSPEILEQYHGFYSLALDGTTDDGSRWCWRMCPPRACARRA